MKQKAIKLLSLLVLCALSAQAQQLGDYNLNVEQSTFQTIVGTPGARTPYLTNNDDGFDDYTLSFSFPYGESIISGNNCIRINANGYLQLMPNSNAGANPYESWNNSSFSYKLIAPAIIADGYCNASVGQGIYYADTIDEDSNSLFIAEFRQMTGYYARNTNTSFNYQIRISANGTIQIVYDECTLDNATFTRNIVITDGHDDRICLTGSWEEPTIGTPTSIPSLDGVPEAGMCYTFSRPVGFCPRPQNVAVTDNSASSLTLSWTGTAAEYGIYLWNEDSEEWEQYATTSDSTATVDGLEPQHTYQLAVASLCEGDNVSTKVGCEGTTACEPIPESELPYIEDFQSNYSNADFVPCWERYYKNYQGILSSGYSQYDNYILFSNEGDNQFLRLQVTPQANTGVGHQTCWVVLPEFEAELQRLQLSFSHKNYRAENGVIEVGVMTSRTDTGSFVAIDTIQQTANWATATVGFATYEGEPGSIALRYYSTEPTSSYGGTTYYCYIDDIAVMVSPSCATPDSITLADIDEHSATLIVHGSDADDIASGEFHITYGREGEEPTVDYFYGSTYDLTNLTPGKRYSVSLYRSCDDGTQTLPLSTEFSTDCGTLTTDDLPYVEDFEQYEAHNGAPIDPCWTILDFNTGATFRSPYPSYSAGHSSNTGLYFNIASNGLGQFVSLPAFDDLSQLMLTFYTKVSSTNAQLQVGVMVDPTDSTTFTPLYTVEPSTSWAEQVVKFDTYEGNGHYITFHAFHRSFTNFAVYIDDVVVDYAVTCPHPLAVSVSASSTESLTLSINDTANTGNYIITYCAEGSTDTLTASATELTHTLEGLEPGATYHISVCAVCIDGSLTSSVECLGQTHCNALTADDLPLNEGFSNWPFGYDDPAFGSCWMRYYDGDITGTQTARKIYVHNDAGSRSLHLYSEASYTDGLQSSLVVLPAIDTNMHYLQFDMRMRFGVIYADSNDVFEVGIVENADDPSTFVPISTIVNPGSQAYADYSIRFGRYNGTGRNIAMRYSYNRPIDFSYAWVDSISVTLLDEEDVICDLEGVEVTDITDSSAFAQWTYSCQADSFFVDLKVGYHTEHLVAYTTQIALADLLPDTLYTLRVRGSHLSDEWSAPVQFRTLATATEPEPEPVGIDEVAASAFELYPNPAHHTATLRTAEAAEVEIADMNGRRVMRLIATAEPTTLDLRSLCPGAYFVRVSTAHSTAVGKLVVR